MPPKDETRVVQRERCAVSDACDGICRENHSKEGRVRCTAFFIEIKEYKKKRGRRTILKRTYRMPGEPERRGGWRDRDRDRDR